MSARIRANLPAIILLVIGLAQMAGDLLGIVPLKAVAAATMISPAPKVFSSVKGLETYSTRIFLDWTDQNGELHSIEFCPEVCTKINGPYNRRNVYGAALAYGPVLAVDERARVMLQSVLAYALTGDAPLLAELGVDKDLVVWPITIRYQPKGESDLGDLPLTLEVPLR
jgi:hypothetical protein